MGKQLSKENQTESKKDEIKLRLNYKFIVHRISIIGDKEVGKSCFCVNLIDKKFNSIYNPTKGKINFIIIGFQSFLFTFLFNHRLFEFHLIDTSDSELYQPLIKQIYKNCDGFILVYDLTNKISFENISNYYNRCLKNKKNYCYILVGNKCDEKDKREVSYEEGKNLAKKMNINFLETSAKSGQNINEIFYCILNEIQNL